MASDFPQTASASMTACHLLSVAFLTEMCLYAAHTFAAVQVVLRENADEEAVRHEAAVLQQARSLRRAEQILDTCLRNILIHTRVYLV
eukprot:6188092-Pleurochrysis_carterae.AAC.1